MKIPRKKLLGIILGPVAFALALLLLPKGLFSYEARCGVGTLLWMGVWWVMLPVHIGVTGFIPIAVNALFNLMPMNTLLAKYASDTVFLLIGADLLTISWEVTGLDKRIALKSLYLIGPSLTQQVLVWFLISAVLSMFLPNLVVCAMLSPIALSMLRYIKEDDLENGRIAPIILVSVAWGAGVGGMGSPLCGAMNLVAINYIEELTGSEYMYTSWIIRMVPMLIIVLLADIACLMAIKPKNIQMNGTKDYFKSMYDALPKISADEKKSLAIFLAVMLLTFTRELFADLLPGLKPAFVFLIGGILTFVIFKEDGKPLNTWEHASKELGWGFVLMVAGGIAVGALLSETGAIDCLAEIMKSMNLTGGFTTMLAFTFFTVLLSEVSNNTSAAAISVPIVISVCKGLGLEPFPYIYTTVAAYNCAYMLPTTVRAIPVGYGLRPKYLLRKGALLTGATILAVSLAGYLFMCIWPAFSAY